jgi:hypothetical protein
MVVIGLFVFLILVILSILAIRMGLKGFGIVGLIVATLILGVVSVKLGKEGQISLKPRKFGPNGVCLVCNGTGEVDCSHCENGNPLYPKWLCPKCKGKVIYTCPECHGLGHFICDACNGNGALCMVKYGVGAPCHGTGKVTCQECGGKGVLECFYCARRERICAYCDGKGTLTCSNCEGRGKEKRLIKRVVRQDGWIEEIYDEGRKGYEKRTYDNFGRLRRIDDYDDKGNWTGSLEISGENIKMEYGIPGGGTIKMEYRIRSNPQGVPPHR